MDAFSTAEPFRYSAQAAAASCADTAEHSQPDHADADRLVRDTKREIQQLVQEIAALCHGRSAPRQFWPRYLARLTAAMAAEGGIIWHRRDGHWCRVVHHGTVDSRLLRSAHASADRTLPRDCHSLMIREVGDGGGPVIVPPGAHWEEEVSAGAIDTAVALAEGGNSAERAHAVEPGNPTEWLAAVVPIPVDPDEPVEWMIELFLPVGGGPATQRGYLRFAAQMADLGADYLRGERLRDARARVDAANRMHAAIAAWAGAETVDGAQQQIVDSAAAFFAAERVSLVRRRGGKWIVAAVSGVASVDARAPAVMMIRDAAAQFPAATGPGRSEPSEPGAVVVGFAPSESDAETAAPWPHVDPPAEALSASTDADADDEPDADDSDGQLTLRGVAVLDCRGLDRLVVEDRTSVEVDSRQKQDWTTFVLHAAALLRQWERVERASWWGRFRHRSHRAGRGPIRRLAPWVVAATVVVALAAVPVPMVVRADARLEPRSVQTLYAPRDSVVAELRIEHGAQVQPGEVLLRLTDRELERSISALLGRRAVLSERSAELRGKLVSRGRSDADETEKLQTEQRVTDEELRSVNAELELLHEERQRLVLRSDRAGVVDAWQVHARLENRPVRRGQPLVRVVAPSDGWVIHADVPQNRLDHVINADGVARASVVLSAFPDAPLEGRVETVGPVTQVEAGNEATGTVLVSVDPSKLPLLQAGAPASVGIRCGRRPLSYVACHDLVRMVLGAWRLYW